jgi:medium-chain acyl-[acyl-carrier-protein] hydrolase
MLKPGYKDWFIPFKQEDNASIRLCCFHYGGGSASAFREWSKDVMDFVELIVVQMPGRENRFNEPLLYNISHVVDKLCMNFDHYMDKPFIFFGHSMGALIAFEFIRSLRRRGKPQPKHLIVSGTKAPQIPLGRQPIHDLPDSKFIEELKRYNGIPGSIVDNRELMSLFLPTIRADFCISETYKYLSEEHLTCPITALGGLSDDTFNPDDLLKWEEQTTCAFKSYFLSGDHFFIKTSYKEVLKIVNQVLHNEITELSKLN